MGAFNRIHVAKATSIGTNPNWAFSPFDDFDPLKVGFFIALGGSLYVWCQGIWEIDLSTGAGTEILTSADADRTGIPREGFIG